MSGRVPSKGVVVSALGIAQTLSWASSYYLPAVLADPISSELGLSRDWFFGIFSAALLLSGLMGPIAGYAIDRRGGRDILALTNLFFAAGLVLLSFASSLASLAAAWVVLGLAMGFGLYEAAFATATGLYGRGARSAITGITLFAGFASTIGWPATAYFTEIYGWRGACLIWASLHIIIGLPLNRLLVPKASPRERTADVAVTNAHPTSAMWILAMVFAACWFVATAMAAHLPRLVEALGATPAMAIAASAMIGPAQVAARLMEYGLLQRASPMTSARLAGILHPIGAGIIVILGAPGAIIFAILHGAGNGLLTIARGTLPLALFGPAGYGLKTGIIAAPARILQGASPLLFGMVLERAGPYWALGLTSALTFSSLMALYFIRPVQETAAAE